MLKDYLKSDLTFLNKKYASFKDMICNLTEIFKKEGYTELDFSKALVEREISFPTGLQLENYAVAIPHGGTEYVNKDFISFVTLEEPVKMHRMDDPEKPLEVDTFFIMGLKNSDNHLKVLKELMSLIQDKEILEQLKQGHSINQIQN
ncbi:PTS sugar transporter subunit IIA (plasmid) [Staphylococcus pseudoxylosus]|uniref:PTS sugar transporter subunit IIA n=1 Tax=Staphylococcus pseudoxylosus TaxID=2282419 RepID=UPI0034D29D03